MIQPSSTFAALALTWLAGLWLACWQGGVAIALAWLVCRAVPKLSPRVCCWVWRLAYLKLIVSFVWSSPIHLPVLPAPQIRRVAEAAQPRVARAMPKVESRPQTAPAKSEPRPHPSSVPCALLVLWLIGVGWNVMDLAQEWRAVRRLRRRSQLLEGWQDGRLEGTLSLPSFHSSTLPIGLRELCEQFNLRRAPRMLASVETESPIVTGVLSPAIVLPSSLLAHCTHNELRLMLAHELAHLKRGDLLWNWLPMLAHVLFFFHPLEFLAKREWKQAHECACDEMALLTTKVTVTDYGKVLLKVVGSDTVARPTSSRGLLAVGVVESFQALKHRLLVMEHIREVSRAKLRLTAVVVAALALTGVVPWRVVAQSAGVWTKKAPMPTGRIYLDAGVVNGILYAIGGGDGVPGDHDGTPLSTVEAYDPMTNNWTTKAPMPTPRIGVRVGVANGIVYAVGGHNGAPGSYVATATVEAYDPVTDTWTTMAPMPERRSLHAVGVVNGILYVAGGGVENGPILSTVFAYDPATDTWTTKASMPGRGRSMHGVGVANGILYVMAGGDGGDPMPTAVFAYDPGTDTWTEKTPIPTARAEPVVGVMDGLIVVAGGSSPQTEVETLEIYDPTADSWTSAASMLTPRTCGAGGVIDGVFYVVGGYSNVHGGRPAGNNHLPTLEAFTPNGPAIATEAK